MIEGSGKVERVKVHATGVVQNPHDPEAEWSAKGRGKHKKEWVGYKVQASRDGSTKRGPNRFYHFGCDAAGQGKRAMILGWKLTLEKQKQMGLERPSEMYVDGAYISAEAITRGKKAEGWGFAGASPT